MALRASCRCGGGWVTSVARRSFGSKQGAKSGGGKAAKKADQKNNAKHYDVFVQALESKANPTVRSPEQLAADFEIVKDWQRGLSRAHNQMQRELRVKIDLKWAAVEQLPTERDREEAQIVPDEPWPAAPIRFPKLDTPPIANFAELKSRGKIVFPKK